MAQIGLEATVNKNVFIIIVIARTIVVVERPDSVVIGNDKVVEDVSMYKDTRGKSTFA